MDVTEFMDNIIAKLNCLASLTRDKCEVLRKMKDTSVSSQYVYTLSIIQRVLKNVESFEMDLLNGALEYNMSELLEEKQSQFINVSVKSGLKYYKLDIPFSTIKDLGRFEAEFKEFFENYNRNKENANEDRIPTEAVPSTSKESNQNVSEDFNDTSWTDPVEVDLQKIFESDSENSATTQINGNTDKEIVTEEPIENNLTTKESENISVPKEIITNSQDVDIRDNSKSVDSGNTSASFEDTITQNEDMADNTPEQSKGEDTSTVGKDIPEETPELSDDEDGDIPGNTKEACVPEDNSEADEERSISQIMDLVENTPEITEGMTKVDNYDATKRIQDELMYVIAEVPYESEENVVKKKKNEENPNNEDMDELIEWFQQDDTEIDSDSSESSNSNTVVYSEPEINEIVAETKEKKISQELRKNEFKLKECYVKLERMKIIRITYNTDDEKYSSSDSSASSDSSEERRINNLCNLSTLENPKKRKYKVSNKKQRLKRRREKITNYSGSETSDLSDCDSLSEQDIKTLKVDCNVKSRDVDPNEILSQIIADLTHTTDDDVMSSADDEDVEKPRKKRLKNNNNNNNDTKKSSKEEDVEDWRNDPLLKQRFDTREKKNNNKDNEKRIHSDSDDSDFCKRIKRVRKARTDWLNESSSSNNSDASDQEATDSNDDVVIQEKNGDSDCEIVGCSGAVPFDVKEEAEHDRLRGRKNILSVLSNESLHLETQRAGKEEEERVMRLEKRLQLKLSQSQELIAERLVLDTTKDGYQIVVDEILSQRAYDHQIEGLKFMWNACYENVDDLKNMEGTGCILAHSMGLGKTFQVFMLVHTLFRHSITATRHVLIVCPLSTVSGWLKEFENGLEIARQKINIRVLTIESTDTTDNKHRRVLRWKEKGGVLIVGYEAFEKLTSLKMKDANRCEKLREALVNPGPDLVVCDEGHLLKNGKTLRTKALMQIRTKRRIALTGTPLQNNLTEYYHMVQFVKPNLLGTKHEFNRQFANPIMNGQYEDSSEYDIQLMKKRSHVLHRLLKNTVQRFESNILKQHLNSMQDYALFIQLHPIQEKLYKKYIEMVRTKRQNDKRMKTFFIDYQVAKYICSHPFLLNTMETQNAQRTKKKIVETDTISKEPEVQEVEGVPSGWWKSDCSEDFRTNLEFGTKLQVMMGIIEEAEKIKEKVLIFTSSLVELNSIEYFLKIKGTSECPSWKSKQDYFRMDGTVPPHRRTQMCDIFNSPRNLKLRVFLMSHKVGGLGLNLVAANRVILLGANFNPSYDLQSIYRAYRFGQEKPVYIYRLLSMGTMEEKIYNRCVSKLAIASRVVDKHQIARHYKNLDLDDLYTINVDLTLQRSTPAKPDDNLLSNVLLKYECIYKYHHHEKLLENRPDEDLNEEDKVKAWEEFKLFSAKENPVTNPATTDPALIPVPRITPSASSVLNPATSSSVRTVLKSKMDEVYSLGRKPNNNLNIMTEIQRYLNGEEPTPSTSRNSNLVQNPCAQQLSKENVATIRKVPPIRIKLPTDTNSTRMPEILKPKDRNIQRQTWRASSSEDFQKPPDFTVVPVRNKRTSCITNKKNQRPVQNKQQNNPEPVVIQDDDDVILVSSTGTTQSESELRKLELEQNVKRLNKSNVTVRSLPRTSMDDDLIVIT